MTAVPAPGGATDSDIKTFRDFLMQYNSVTELCFTACVRDFTTRTVVDKEDKCTNHCLDKFLKMSQRMSMRFQEYQMSQAEAAGPGLRQ